LAPLCRLKLKALLHLGGHAGEPTTASSVPEEKTFKNALGKINDTPLQYFAATRFDANTPKIKMSLKQKPWTTKFPQLQIRRSGIF
jgi:hypothetical protein